MYCSVICWLVPLVHTTFFYNFLQEKKIQSKLLYLLTCTTCTYHFLYNFLKEKKIQSKLLYFFSCNTCTYHFYITFSKRRKLKVTTLFLDMYHLIFIQPPRVKKTQNVLWLLHVCHTIFPMWRRSTLIYVF